MQTTRCIVKHEVNFISVNQEAYKNKIIKETLNPFIYNNRTPYL